jgi:hypothetical protein
MNIKACGQEEEVDIIQLYYIILSIFKITHPAAPCWFTHVFSATLVKAVGVILHTELITNSLLHNYR